MEQRELYDFDRDRPGPSIEKDQFDRMVDERNKRIKMEKAKEINNKRLTNLKDFIKYYESTIV
jgi:competence protein ComGC